ncbi:hypothetical protein DACRYDRAFT_112357 [Dacryopinax primogenitus]|uniref:N-acetyltransferase domain-containing protein n=1 Tax=Dacryopinax primogenitus (strain DJM 731) TaxID=1858805 RepID=M5FZU5_DACPD|nr:uncharacterized protein DACRYDRAFT_112357 [Dacryopinax primogenitus]EJT97032.1 hypothetical protein DACRYDRAFT_112357 [Dacryopinax primogenitus]
MSTNMIRTILHIIVPLLWITECTPSFQHRRRHNKLSHSSVQTAPVSIIVDVPAPEPRLVRYSNPSALLRACLPFDTWHMNIALGLMLQYLVFVGDSEPGPREPKLWFGVWTADQLDLVFVRAHGMGIFCSPVHSSLLFFNWLSTRMHLVASALHTLIVSHTQTSLSSVFGAIALVQAFIPAYAAISGLEVCASVVRETLHTHCPASRVSLDPPNLPEGHEIRVVRLGENETMDGIVKFLQEFSDPHRGPVAAFTLDMTQKRAKFGVWFGDMMLYVIRSEDGEGEEYAGFVRVGRVTGRYAAVSSVFTAPKWRRRGIAEALTRAAVVRLLSQPNNMADIIRPLMPPPQAGDEEAQLKVASVCIFAEKSNVSAQGIYTRVGFGFQERGWEEEGAKSWEECIEMAYAVRQGAM